jgi:hypothetical protein
MVYPSMNLRCRVKSFKLLKLNDSGVRLVFQETWKKLNVKRHEAKVLLLFIGLCSVSKSKAISVTGRGGLQAGEMLRIPHCLDFSVTGRGGLQAGEMLRIPHCLDFSVTGRGGLQAGEMLRIPHCLDNQPKDGGQFVNLKRSLRSTP